MTESRGETGSSTTTTANSSSASTTNNDDDQNKQIQAAFEKICTDLSIDKKVSDIAWRGYDAVRKQCTLEGDQVPWLACSVYVACWLCPPSTVSDQGRKVPPLTIVETCHLSIIDFFEKLQKWVDMANMSRKFQDQVIKMESAFAVTSVIYKKFEPIFATIFVNNSTTDSATAASDGKGGSSTRPKRGKRPAPSSTPQRQTSDGQSQQYGYGELMEFCWVLYIYAKRCFVGLGDDIMSSYHILLCALDVVYVNVVNAKRNDLLSPDFQVRQPIEDNSVLESLCKEFDGIILDAKHMRVHWWKPKMKSFVNESVLHGDADTLTELFTPANFEFNLNALHERYEEAILKRGDMDERVFIPKHVGHPLITNTPKKKRVDSDSDGEDSMDYERDLLLRRNVQACLDRVNHYQVPAAHATRGYPFISNEQFCPITPAVTQTAARLQSLVVDCSLGPNPELKAMLGLIRPNPTELIHRVVQNTTDAFFNACIQEVQACGEGEEQFSEFANHSRETAEMMYYRILEKIIQTEKERQANVDLGNVLGQEIFHKSLFACATELILFSYCSEKQFPWVLQMFDLPAYYFYKVVELVIRAETDLSREMVKHLNEVEEKCLEEHVWVKNSPLWEVLANKPIPSYEDIALIDGIDTVGPGAPRSGHGGHYADKQPAVAKRRLDFEPGGGMPTSVSVRGMQADHQSLRINSIQLPGSGASNAGPSAARNDAPTRKIISNSLALFFRKVYYLASLRLNDLCERLRINDVMKQQAWAMFDHVLRKNTELMRGRHLDQLLMCSIYIIAKVTKQDVSFQDIMCSYRAQPQAKSRVYRNVLLDHKSTTPTDEMENHESGTGTREKLRSGSTLPIPTIGSAPPTPTPVEEEYGDLIKFYNQVFVTKMEEIAKQLSASTENAGDKESIVPLSPMPVLKSQPLSPRRRVADAVYVSPMKGGFLPHSPSRPLRYSFSRSPYKDLRAINNMLRAGAEHAPGKMMAGGYAYRRSVGEPSHLGPVRRFNT